MIFKTIIVMLKKITFLLAISKAVVNILTSEELNRAVILMKVE